MLGVYDDLDPPSCASACEDVVLNRQPDCNGRAC